MMRVPTGNHILAWSYAVFAVIHAYLDKTLPASSTFGLRIFMNMFNVPGPVIAAIFLICAWQLSVEWRPKDYIVWLLPEYLYLFSMGYGTLAGEISVRGMIPVWHGVRSFALAMSLIAWRYHEAELAAQLLKYKLCEQEQTQRVEALEQLVPQLRGTIDARRN